MQKKLYPFIELPVLFDRTDPALSEQFENLGISTQSEEIEIGIINVNINHIIAYNESDEGLARVMLSNGIDMNFQISFKDFKNLLINYYSNH